MDTRQRMIESTVGLLRRQGYSGTGMSEIVQASQAPRGSIYHHFPQGKEQLAAEALRLTGAMVTEKIRGVGQAGEALPAALRAYVTQWAEEIRSSGYERGCSVGNTAMDVAATVPALRRVCEEVFGDWEDAITESLVRYGTPPRRARGLAEFILSSLEGALILCRARRSTGPLERVTEEIAARLPPSRERPRSAP